MHDYEKQKPSETKKKKAQQFSAYGSKIDGDQ